MPASDSDWRQSIGGILLVTVVSVLIWYWASTATSLPQDLEFGVRFSIPEERRSDWMLLSPRESTWVIAKARGSAVGRRDAQDFVRGGLELRLGQPGVPETVGDGTVELAVAIRAALERARIDISLESIDPVQIPLRLDERARVTTGVVPVFLGARTDGEVIVQPSEVEVIGPRALIDRAGRFRVEAAVDDAALSTLEAGRRHTRPVRLRFVPEVALPDQSDITLTTTSAEVTFTLAARTVALRIGIQESPVPGVPVHVAISPVDLERFEVDVAERDRLLRDIELSGPPEQIALIQQGRARVFAYVALTSDDLDRAVLEGGSLVRQVSLWSLPPEVRVVQPGRTDAQIEAQRIGETPPAGIRLSVRRRSVD